VSYSAHDSILLIGTAGMRRFWALLDAWGRSGLSENVVTHSLRANASEKPRSNPKRNSVARSTDLQRCCACVRLLEEALSWRAKTCQACASSRRSRTRSARGLQSRRHARPAPSRAAASDPTYRPVYAAAAYTVQHRSQTSICRVP